jgi:hypothetical protein
MAAHAATHAGITAAADDKTLYGKGPRERAFFVPFWMHASEVVRSQAYKKPMEIHGTAATMSVPISKATMYATIGPMPSSG